jgi:hypothetical protein
MVAEEAASLEHQQAHVGAIKEGIEGGKSFHSKTSLAPSHFGQFGNTYDVKSALFRAKPPHTLSNSASTDSQSRKASVDPPALTTTMEKEGMEEGYAMSAMGTLRIELGQYDDHRVPVATEVTLLTGKANLDHTDVIK